MILNLPERPIRRLVEFIHRHPYAVLVGALLLTGALGSAGGKLRLKSRIQDLLPGSAPSVQAMDMLEKRLGSADILVVTLMTNDFPPVIDALPKIAKAAESHPDVMRVMWRQDVDLIERNALTIFPTQEDLDEFYEELTDSIREAVKKRLDLGLEDVDAPPEAREEEPEPERTFVWGELEDDDGLSEFGRAFRDAKGQYGEYFFNRDYTTVGIQIYPSTPSSDMKFCRRIIAEMDALVRAEVERHLGPIGEGNLVTRVDLGGGYRDALRQSQGIQNDLVSSATWSFSLLMLVVILFFRSIRAVFCVMVPLVISNVWLVGLIALTVGYLNLLTAFIFAVLLGIGIDFGIHFYGRYREERARGLDAVEAMVQTHVHCGEASILAALTTSTAFLALTLADFKGFSQFGGVASMGVLLCLTAVFILFPAINFIFERWFPLRLLGYSVDRTSDGDFPRGDFPLGRLTVVVACLISVGGMVAGAQHIEFELDMDKLGEKVKTGAAEYQTIQNGTVQSTVPAVIFADSPEEARSLHTQLEEKLAAGDPNSKVKSQQSLFTLIPSAEEQKAKQKQVRRICRKLRRKVKLFEGDPRFGADELLAHCDPVDFTPDELPDWVVAKFSDREGKVGEFIFVAARGSISDGEVALGFRNEMMALKGTDGEPPVVSGKPMIWADVIIAMKRDGLITAVASLTTVTLLLLVFFRSPRRTALVMIPLFVALGSTCGLMVLLDIKLNFFNMLALPTLIGMGVDDGVHVYHRYEELGSRSGPYILKTTGLAVLLTTVTTSIGFGSLLTANHYGLISLGFLTILGMVSALISTVVVLPAALRWMDDRAAAA